MLRRLSVIALIAALLGACAQSGQQASAPPPTSPAEVVLSAARAAGPQAVTLHVGQTLVLKLEANVTTGYSWALENPVADGLKPEGEGSYTSDPHPAGMVGVGGIETWRFEALAAGEYALQMIYRRPWIKQANPTDEHLRVAVTVLGGASP